MNNEKPVNKPVKKVQFFDAKQHIEIIRQIKGDTAFIERQEVNRNKARRSG